MFPVGPDNRYVYAPQVLLNLAVLALAVTRSSAVGAMATVFAGWLMTAGAIYFYVPSSRVVADGPAWRTELALHRQDHAHIIASWPPGWQVRLPDDVPAAAGSPQSAIR
jgi:hypothetical protein